MVRTASTGGRPLSVLLLGIIYSGCPAEPWRVRRAVCSSIAEPLLTCFIEAHHGIVWIVGQQRGSAAHPPWRQTNLVFASGGYMTFLTIKRLEVIFFRACHTVTVLMVSTKPKTTSSSASSSKVQWQRPHGGSLHASSSTAVRRCP